MKKPNKLPTKAQITAAIKRTAPQVKKYTKFMNVLGMTWGRGLGRFDKDIIVFKKVYISRPKWSKDPFGTTYCSGFSHSKPLIAAMLLPADALTVIQRDSVVGKCRCDKAFVLSFVTVKDKKPYTLKKGERVTSGWKSDYLYPSNEWVKPEYKFDTSDRSCKSGVHFFLTAGQAGSW